MYEGVTAYKRHEPHTSVRRLADGPLSCGFLVRVKGDFAGPSMTTHANGHIVLDHLSRRGGSRIVETLSDEDELVEQRDASLPVQVTWVGVAEHGQSVEFIGRRDEYEPPHQPFGQP